MGELRERFSACCYIVGAQFQVCPLPLLCENGSGTCEYRPSHPGTPQSSVIHGDEGAVQKKGFSPPGPCALWQACCSPFPRTLLLEPRPGGRPGGWQGPLAPHLSLPGSLPCSPPPDGRLPGTQDKENTKMSYKSGKLNQKEEKPKIEIMFIIL